MAEVQTIVAFPAPNAASPRAVQPAHQRRAAARIYRTPIVPMYRAKPLLRERRQAGLGMAIAFGFSAICWAGIAALIF